MQQVVLVKLKPGLADRAALDETLRACNEQANQVSREVFGSRNRDSGRIERFQVVQQRCYARVRAAGLGAQAAIHVIKKVHSAYAALHGQVAAGVLRGKRKQKALQKPLSFRRESAQPFDDRCLSWDLGRRTISIWTIMGRRKRIQFACSKRALKVLETSRQGESNLLLRDGEFYLAATVEVPEAEQFTPVDFVGIDRGIVNLATTSDGDNYQGTGLRRYRKRQARLRAKLQKKGTKSAKRLLKKRRRKERRHASHQNHEIAREIVSVAERTGRGIAIENLEGIRERVRFQRSQRGMISNWQFFQLQQYLAYKARRAGVPMVIVDARHTSQMCPLCHHTERANRRSRDEFECRGCGLAGPADVVGAVNTRNRGRLAWAIGQRSLRGPMCRSQRRDGSCKLPALAGSTLTQ